MRDEPFVPALGALSGGQAVQSVKAGLKAIYCSGWQVAADANTAGQVYPDQSLYPADAVPTLVKRLNRALTRADQIEHAEGGESSEGRRGEGFCGFLLPSARSGQRSRGSCLLSPSSERSGANKLPLVFFLRAERAAESKKLSLAFPPRGPSLSHHRKKRF